MRGEQEKIETSFAVAATDGYSTTHRDSQSDRPRAIADALKLERVDNAFRSVQTGSDRHLLGGLVIAQALNAATHTVKTNQLARSLFIAFLSPGDGRQPMTHGVEATRDGPRFSTRQVTVSQDSDVLALATVNYHAMEDGLEFSEETSGPFDPPDSARRGRYDSPFFESREDDAVSVAPATQQICRAWFRARVPLPDHPPLHQQALAYISDLGPTRAIRNPHLSHPYIDQRRSLTLDHAIWFHRAGRADEWVRFDMKPVSTTGGRGLASGSIVAADGTLLITVTQAAWFRVPPAGDSVSNSPNQIASCQR
jgi:acyl-CoA thioesterase-2